MRGTETSVTDHYRTPDHSVATSFLELWTRVLAIYIRRLGGLIYIRAIAMSLVALARGARHETAISLTVAWCMRSSWRPMRDDD